jgi:hypothetical protein
MIKYKRYVRNKEHGNNHFKCCSAYFIVLSCYLFLLKFFNAFIQSVIKAYFLYGFTTYGYILEKSVIKRTHFFIYTTVGLHFLLLLNIINWSIFGI